ncbi:integrase domain-containing protein [Brenneria populi]|uniref:integrase domain-containing protein n=1 Tax=Brenneria populi TaxID=1505588 RepID=UPI0032EDFDBD
MRKDTESLPVIRTAISPERYQAALAILQQKDVGVALTLQLARMMGLRSQKGPCTRILCKCLFSEVTVQAVTELDNKAAHVYTPIPQRHRPFL